MSSRAIGAAAVIVDGVGKVLLVKHSYGRLNWELPGGGSEANESAQETAVREVAEETGLRVSVDRLTGVYYEGKSGVHHFVFACSVGESAVPRPDGIEIAECNYWSPDALPRPISDFTVRRISDALAGTSPTTIVAIPPRRWIE